MTRSLIAATLITSVLLAGCGAAPTGAVSKASLGKASTTKAAGVIGPNTASVIGANTAGVIGANTAGIVGANSARVAPLVGLARGVEVPAAGLVSSLRLVAHHAMADDELRSDAESQGYSIMATDAKQRFEKTGFIRKTEGGWQLEAQKGSFFSKEKDIYTLIPGTTAITTRLHERHDKKATIRGLAGADKVVDVTAVSNAMDLGFLTNWFTKGKIVGHVKHAGTKATLEGVTVTAKSEDGALFTAATDDEGAFAIKSLTPGKFYLKLELAGYQTFTATDPETVAKRDKAEFEGLLAPVAAPAN
jgi:hypothetical protein